MTPEADALFNANLAWAEKFAAWYLRTRVRERNPNYADLMQAALIGLWQAAQRYEDGRGVMFTTYARHKIKSAIRDEMRANTPASRRRIADDVVLLPLDRVFHLSGKEEGTLERLVAKERREQLRAAIPNLRDGRLWHVVAERLRGRTLQEIAADLNLTQSRVCQLHRRAVEALKTRLAA